MKTLSFDKERHEYTVDGQIVPSVTQIVATITGKDLSVIPPEILGKARDRGIEIHADVESGTYKTPEGAWIADQNYGLQKTYEKMGYGEVDGFMFCGTADIITDLGIDDIKTEATNNILYWTIQLNLYRQIFGGERLRVLHTPKTGNYHIVPIAVLPDEKIVEIIKAYREQRILDDSFLSIPKHDIESLDLIVTKFDLGVLQSNAEATYEKVKEIVSSYNASNYSEENIDEAKKDKAKLNKLAQRLNDKKIEYRNKWNQPFDEAFGNIIDKAVKEAKTGYEKIDVVAKEVETREKSEKREQIEKFFESTGCKFFTLGQIFNLAWLNKTTKIKDVQAEIVARIKKTEDDLLILDRINEMDAKAYYLQTLDLDSALKRADEIKANREQLAEIQKERETKRVEDTKSAPTFIPESIKEQEASQDAATEEFIPVPALLERTLWVRGTFNQIVALGDFMNDNGIEFRKL